MKTAWKLAVLVVVILAAAGLYFGRNNSGNTTSDLDFIEPGSTVTMGTSLATMIPLAIVGGGIKLAQGFVALGAGLLLASGTIVGAQFGAAVIKKIRPNILKLIFGLYFLYVSLKFILGYFGIAIW